jgi:hypothetical protein
VLVCIIAKVILERDNLQLSSSTYPSRAVVRSTFVLFRSKRQPLVLERIKCRSSTVRHCEELPEAQVAIDMLGERYKRTALTLIVREYEDG